MHCLLPGHPPLPPQPLPSLRAVSVPAWAQLQPRAFGGGCGWEGGRKGERVGFSRQAAQARWIPSSAWPEEQGIRFPCCFRCVCIARGESMPLCSREALATPCFLWCCSRVCCAGRQSQALVVKSMSCRRASHSEVRELYKSLGLKAAPDQPLAWKCHLLSTVAFQCH